MGARPRVKLAKWQGLGNDYLIVEEVALPAPLTRETIGLLCDRHLGVGSDGILLKTEPTGAVPGAVARMRVFNPDGGEPEMCGNGIRQFARYLAGTGAVDTREFVVETLAGPIKPRLLDDGAVRVDMGRARFRSGNIAPEVGAGAPWDGAEALVRTSAGGGSTGGADVVDAVLQARGVDYRFTFVDVGNPHCVIFVDDPATFDVAGVGPVIEHHPFFPNRVNVEFIRVEPDGSVRMRVWERGVGETQACGTGATAVGAACVRLGRATSPVLAHLLGGDLTIEVETGAGTGAAARTGAACAAAEAGDPATDRAAQPTEGLRVFMTGPAEEVFTAELSPELLRRLGWPAPSAD
ncbi:MAG: diaminopimelate epimerase [Thermoleophilia bacterium]|nr:diaminopimelate epimerase [Thermoleophilia bacterium]